MVKEQVHFVRELLIFSGCQAPALRRVFSQLQTEISWRILKLEKEVYLAVSSKSLSVEDNSIDANSITEFAKKSDSEVMRIGRIAAIMSGVHFSAQTLPNRFVAIVRSSGETAQLNPKERLEFASHRVSIQFRTEAAHILSGRPDAVRIYFDGTQSGSNAREVSEYFRLLEAGFGRKGGDLQSPLLKFLSTGHFPIDEVTWKRLKRLRDRLSHAYRSGQIDFDRDALQDAYVLQLIAADVLLHKSHWGSDDSARSLSDLLASYRTLDGSIVVAAGMSMSSTLTLLDSVTGLPVHLSPEKYNKSYRRYADRFHAYLKAYRQ